VVKEKRGRTFRDNYRERELARESSDPEYFSQLRRHKQHQDNFFGEVSYFKAEDVRRQSVVEETS